MQEHDGSDDWGAVMLRSAKLVEAAQGTNGPLVAGKPVAASLFKTSDMVPLRFHEDGRMMSPEEAEAQVAKEEQAEAEARAAERAKAERDAKNDEQRERVHAESKELRIAEHAQHNAERRAKLEARQAALKRRP